jgi:phage N-6-adenine-methyltransferase
MIARRHIGASYVDPRPLSVVPRTAGLVRFRPQQTRLKLGALREGVKLAAKIKDWDALEGAVDAIIAEQRAFVAWWSANVAPGREDRRNPVVARQRQQVLTVADAVAQTGVTKQQVSKWRLRLKDEPGYREILREGAHAAMWALQSMGRSTFGSGENEWYTPAEYLAAARVVLGDIDVDPATSAAAQRVVKAKEFFTKDDDGLRQEWHGRVWLNPPYAQPLIAEFVAKLLLELEDGRVSSAILLTNNSCDTVWFQSAAERTQAICFTRGRIRFESPDGELLASPGLGQAFCYFGADAEKFISCFARFGFVVVRP